MMEEIPSIKPLLDAAEEYYQLHNVSRSLFYYKQALEWEVPDLRLCKGLARCYFALGDFDSSLEYWEKAADMDGLDEEVEARLILLRSPSFQSWLKRMSDAVKTVEMKDYLRARDQFKDVLEEKDGVVSIYQILGLTHMACSDPESARRIWNKGLQFDTSNPMLLKYLKSLDEIENNRDIANEFVEEAKPRSHRLIVGSSFVIILGLLGFFLFNRWGIYKTQAVRQIAPETFSANTMITEPNTSLITASLKIEEGILSREGAIGMDPNSQPNREESTSDEGSKREWQLYREGFTDYLRGDLYGAQRAFSSIVSRSSGSYINRESLYYLARINYLVGDIGDAEICFRNYLGQFPDTNYCDESLYYLGCIYHRTGREEQARSMLAQLVVIEPNSGYLSTKNSREILRSGRG